MISTFKISADSNFSRYASPTSLVHLTRSRNSHNVNEFVINK